MAAATETIVLVHNEDSSGETSSKRSFFVTAAIIILLVFQPLALFPLSVYCYRTIYCGINEKQPLYNCDKSPKIIGFGSHEAMVLELTFACTEVLSRLILVILGFISLFKRGPICRMFCKPLCKSWKTLPFAAVIVLCVLRFGLILSHKENLGQEVKIAKATHAMYVLDTLGITAVVTILGFVKLRDLAKDNVSSKAKLCQVRGTCVIMTERAVFVLFKCVLVSFCLEYVLYFILVALQIYCDVRDANKNSVGEKEYLALTVLKNLGQVVFNGTISTCLWKKLFDDNKCILRTKTDEGRQTPQTAGEQSSIRACVNRAYMSVSDQSPSEDMALSSSSEYFTASDSSIHENRQTPQRPQSSLRCNSCISINGQSSLTWTAV